ncbi:MAG: DUF2142 domain-containing protein [Leucobacter sp.]
MGSSRWKRAVVTFVLGLLAFVGLGGWALASPVGAAPDDDFHLASIWCAWGDRDGLCSTGEEDGVKVVPQQLVLAAHCYAFQPDQSAACVPTEDATLATTRVNSSGNYPPIFYGVTGAFASQNIDASVISIRLFNSAIFVGAVIAVLALLRPGQRGPLIWSSAIALVPVGVFFIASANPSSWAVLSGVTVWIALTGYFTSKRRSFRIALGALGAVLGVMGAGARSDAAVYVAFAALAAMILSYRRGRDWLKLAVLPLALIAIGAYFFLTSGQTSWAVVAGAEQILDSGGETGSSLALLVSNFVMLPYLWAGNLGTWGLGWLDTTMLPTVWIVMIGVFVAVVFWGVRVMGRRKALVLALAILALIAMPLYVLHGQQAAVGTEVQPRYILPLMLIFTGVALSGFTRDDLGLSRLQGFVVLFGVAVANALALHTNMQRYLTGLDRSGANLNTNIEWWWSIPISPMTVWFVGSAAFALLMLGLYLLLFTGPGRRLLPGSEAGTAVEAPAIPAVTESAR